MPTRSGYNVRVQNGQVTDCWDTPAPEGQDGWSAAVEITPDLTPNREILTTHSFDITKNPIEIVWGKRELTVDERKGSLIGQANFAVTMIENQIYTKDELTKIIKETRKMYEKNINNRFTFVEFAEFADNSCPTVWSHI